MDHPTVTQIMRTGYPAHVEEHYETCEQCSDEITETVVYEGITFCSPACLGKYLLDNGDAKWSA